MLKLIIFDWDGTLADSVIKIISCKQVLAKKYNLAEPSEKVVRNVLGTQFKSALATCFPEASASTLEEIGQEFHKLMQQDNYQAILFPQVKQILMTLKEKGYKLAVATSKNRQELDKAIQYNNLTNVFDVTCCGDNYKSKPDPAMLYYMMELFNVSSNECLMIGDTTTDILFAHNAGVKAIAVNFGAHPKEKLETENPDGFIDDLGNLTESIEQVCHSTQKYYPF